MTSRALRHHLDLITWLKTSPTQWLINSGSFESSDEKSTVQTKSNFDFFCQLWNSKFLIIKICQMNQDDHQKIKNSKKVNKKSKFQRLRNFSKCFSTLFFANFMANSHQVPLWFKKSVQHKSCRGCSKLSKMSKSMKKYWVELGFWNWTL